MHAAKQDSFANLCHHAKSLAHSKLEILMVHLAILGVMPWWLTVIMCLNNYSEGPSAQAIYCDTRGCMLRGEAIEHVPCSGLATG